MEGGTYDVDLAVQDEHGVPERSLGKRIDKLMSLLPEGAHLRALRLPDDGGPVEVEVYLRAISPADALHKLSLAEESTAMTFSGRDVVGVLQHAHISHVPDTQEAPHPAS
jgi:hypothetical protein